MIETIYITRHGFRANWVAAKWTISTGLARDPPLAAFGETQALELASYLGSLPKDKQPSAIFSSPYCKWIAAFKLPNLSRNASLYRSILSTDCLNGIPPSPLEQGCFLGQRMPSKCAMLPEINPSWNTVEIDPSWSTIWLPPRTGEDLEGIHARVADFLDLFIHQVDTRSDMCLHKNVLLFSHAAPIIAMCRHLAGQPELPLRVGCCTLSEFSRKRCGVGGKEGSRWDVVSLASSAHLKEQGTLMNWGFEDVLTDYIDDKVTCDVGVPGTEEEEDNIFGPQIHSNKLRGLKCCMIPS